MREAGNMNNEEHEMLILRRLSALTACFVRKQGRPWKTILVSVYHGVVVAAILDCPFAQIRTRKSCLSE